MKKMKEVVFLKGKESIGVSLLLLLAIVIFFVPITMILLLRFLYRMVQIAKVQAKIPEGFSAKFEKVY